MGSRSWGRRVALRRAAEKLLRDRAGSGIVPIVKIRVKISEFDAARASAKQPLQVLDTIEVEAPATSNLDQRKELAKAKAIEHVKRPFRSIQHAKLVGGRDGFTVIVGKKG